MSDEAGNSRKASGVLSRLQRLGHRRPTSSLYQILQRQPKMDALGPLARLSDSRSSSFMVGQMLTIHISSVVHHITLRASLRCIRQFMSALIRIITSLMAGILLASSSVYTSYNKSIHQTRNSSMFTIILMRVDGFPSTCLFP